MKTLSLLAALLCASFFACAQADNEIQVYASPTIGKGRTIFELHSNYTFRGSRLLAEPGDARWLNETLEITHGFGAHFELGFYTFTALAPDGRWHYLGNQLRPRITVPAGWNWSFGASLSLEFGFFRLHTDAPFAWQGELRPIIDKTAGNWYFSFNPNIDFAVTGSEKGAGLSPQFKTVYTLQKTWGLGLEYYAGLGNFSDILPLPYQEHLLGPMLDLYVHPDWEIQAGMLFGLTDHSNQRIVKLLLGRRRGK